MRAVVAGLGSMGKRRIRLMRAFFPEIEIAGVDSGAGRREEAARLFGVPCFEAVGDTAAFSPDIGFVSTPPLSHAAITAELLSAGAHVFSEINLVADGYDENLALAEKNGRVLFLSSTPMYRKEIEYITGRVKGNGKIRYRYHVGQYLPDWHPWESYKDFFVGDARTNGCRELFAVELPWLTAAFGNVERFSAEKAKLTALDIGYPDCYAVTLCHAGGVLGHLMVDVVSRKPVRDLEVIGEDVHLFWGGTPETVTDYDIEKKRGQKVECYAGVTRDARYADNIIEDAYVAEIADFLRVIAGESAARHSFAADKAMLSLLDQIEGSEKQR